MEKKILDALTEKYTGVKESILRRVATKLAKTVTSEDDIATAVEGAFADVLEAYGDQRATDATKTAVLNYEKKHNLKDGKAISGDEPNQEPTSSEPGGDEAPAWAKKLIEANTALKERLDQLNGERMQSSRKSVIDKLIEPLPASIRKAYQRQELASMSEEDFTALQEEIKAEVDEINSDLSAKGAVFGKPAATGGRSDSNKGKASDAEADAVALPLLESERCGGKNDGRHQVTHKIIKEQKQLWQKQQATLLRASTRRPFRSVTAMTASSSSTPSVTSLVAAR